MLVLLAAGLVALAHSILPDLAVGVLLTFCAMVSDRPAAIGWTSPIEIMAGASAIVTLF